jgi:aspartate racemase
MFNLNYPVSFPQQRLWFIDKIRPDTTAFNLTTSICFDGLLDISALQCSLNEIVRRHDILRTTFTSIDGEPIQVVASTLELPLPLVDLSVLPDLEGQEKLQQLLSAQANFSFMLSQGPLLHTVLIRLHAETHLLLLVMHHIISDGCSMDILYKELRTLYQAYYMGIPSPLTELPIQYANFANWQHRWLQGQDFIKQTNYWKHKLAGSPEMLSLPTDRPRPMLQSFRGRRLSLSLSKSLSSSLKILSHQQKVTLFMTVLAAFKVLLYRYSGQEDILVGVAIANRTYTEIENLIGFFVNLLVMRTDLSGNPSFCQLLQRIREVAINAYAHQNLPFEKLVAELELERNLNHTPLFQVAFNLHQTDRMDTYQLEDCTLTYCEIYNETAKYDLWLNLYDTAEGIYGFFEYSTDLFNDATIAQMAKHFQIILESFVVNLRQGISEFSFLTTLEENKLLVEWNNTQVNYPSDECIHHLFEKQVQQTPDAIAVVFENEHLTYQALNLRTNQLAHYLQQLGVKTEMLVGICVERSLEMIVAILGVLKAGGAYIPLDPNYPVERINYMLEDAQPEVIITQTHLAEKFSSQPAKIIDINKNWSDINVRSGENIKSSINTKNLAYIIYTSGSSGKPKPVMVEHRSLVNFVYYDIKQWEIKKSDRFLQFNSFSFDALAKDIYPCLCAGATLILRTEEMLNSFSNFVFKCFEWKVTILLLPTAFWHQLVSEIDSTTTHLLKFIRLIFIGGERMQSDKLQLWQLYMNNLIQSNHIKTLPKLINAYGPTEATIVTTYFDASTFVPDEQNESVPIGRPIANVTTYILGKQLQPVPIGVFGELYIGGLAVTRGYFKHPELTTEKFIPNPFKNPKFTIQNSRLYKTGDLARYLCDGNIEYLCRIDNQVKIRGFRIELAEIEVVLGQHPFVQQVVVMARENVTDDNQLIAYIVPVHEQIIENSELYRFSKLKLPHYMIPSAFVFLDALPQTSNGKIDIKALPAPNLSNYQSEKSFIAPRNELELQLAKIWENLLGIQSISVKDSFFALGGHSLLSLKLFAEIQLSFSKNIPLINLYQFDTIEEIAKILGQEKSSVLNKSTDDYHNQYSLKNNSLLSSQEINELTVGISHIKGRRLGQNSLIVEVEPGNPNYKHPFFYLGWGLDKSPGALGADQPVYWLPLSTRIKNPTSYIKNLATFYINEIRAVQPEGPYIIGGECFGCWPAFEMAQQLQAQGEKVALLILLEQATLPPFFLFLQHCVYRLTYHWSYFKQLNLYAQLTYIKKLIKLIVKQIFSKLFGEKIIVNINNDYRSQVVSGLAEAKKNYVPQLYNGQVALFFANEGGQTSFLFPKGGWGNILKGPVEVHIVPGDHTSFLEQPNIQILLEQLKICLEKAQVTISMGASHFPRKTKIEKN